MHLRVLAAAFGLLSVAPLYAQEAIPFPLADAGLDAEFGIRSLAPDPAAIAGLMDFQELRLTGATLSTGSSPDLLLRRLDLDSMDFGFRVNGQPAPGMLDGLDLSVWVGTVDERPDSDVMLSFSQAGTRGWINDGELLTHLMPAPDENGDWSRGLTYAVNEFELSSLGLTQDFLCGANSVVPLDQASRQTRRPPSITGGVPTALSSTGQLYRCRMAIETDFQLFQLLGNDLGAETAYVTSILAAANDRYVEQFNTELTFPYLQFYTTPNDPWSTPDQAGQLGISSFDLLDEFSGVWGGGNLPVEAELGHFISGSDLGGGVAYVGVLCDQTLDFIFGVSGGLDGLLSFPVQQGPLTFDFAVFVHEVGHNFSSPHTNDYCPPIDECAPSPFLGVCQDGTDCSSQGSIMSLCHLCPGGDSNTVLQFHPEVVEKISGHVSECLPLVVGFAATPPLVIPPGQPTPLVADIVGTPVTTVDLNYRFDPADSFLSMPMTNQGGGQYTADLPAASCDEQPEFFFSMIDSFAGLIETDLFTPQVGIETIFFQDDFEDDQGWIAGVPSDDATEGIWTRDAPFGTGAQPSAGFDPFNEGTYCFFTGQGTEGGSLGQEDIDDGQTTLISPMIDLAGSNAEIGYWRWFSNDEGIGANQDVLTIEITNNNGSSWVTVETVGPDDDESSGNWFYHQFTVSDFVTPTANVRMRFIAADEGSSSVVEAAIDQFEVFQFECEICQPDLGFSGPGTADLSVCGTLLTPTGSATLRIDNANSNAPAILGISTVLTPTPLLGGIIVTQPLLGTIPLSTNAAGSASFEINGGLPPSIVYLQAAVIEDNGSVTLSNAVAVEFLP